MSVAKVHQYGNAVYVMYEDWEILSRRSRVELLTGPRENFDRIEHRKGWKDILRAIVHDHRRRNGSRRLL